ILVEGGDGENVNLVTILDMKRCELRFNICRIGSTRDIETQHRALFVRIEPLDLYMAQRGSRQNSSGHTYRLRECRPVTQLIDRWTPHHPIHLNQRTYRRHEQGVARLQSLYIGAHPAQ